MESNIFSTPHNSTERDAFKPSTELPEHSKHYLDTAQEARLKATEVIKTACGLTDLMALRAAALPETH